RAKGPRSRPSSPRTPPPRRRWTAACATCRCTSKARAPAASRPCARCRAPASTSPSSATSRRFPTTAAGRRSAGACNAARRCSPLARYTDSVCRLCRREGLKLFLKGERCYTDKCAIERRNYPPGDHGQGRTKFSEYAVQLREKQKVKRMYGLMERQFRRYFTLAERSRGITGETLLLLLEQRLDNMVYRM